MLTDTLSIPASFSFYAAMVLAVAMGMLMLSHLLGERHDERSTGRPYESGIKATGPARGRIPAGFYRVGLLFVIFELETVFIFAWSLISREAGWPGYIGILIFLAILLVALLYLSRVGALAWDEPEGRQRPVPRNRGCPTILNMPGADGAAPSKHSKPVVLLTGGMRAFASGCVRRVMMRITGGEPPS